MIKYLIMDVDGTLTDGKIYMSDDGEIMKAFNIKDGYVIAHIRQYGIEPIILTGRKSKIVENRAAELGITQVIQGVQDKATYLRQFTETVAEKEELAYIGDDLNDYEAMQLCGTVGCPADAVKEVKKISEFVATCRGGEGAVREFVDYLREKAK